MPPAIAPAPEPDNPLLSGAALPDFPAILPAHVEPAMRLLLEECRTHLATLAAREHPTFDSVVVPLEQMRHRLARTWSPVAHLNAVMNSEALRSAHNACL